MKISKWKQEHCLMLASHTQWLLRYLAIAMPFTCFYALICIFKIIQENKCIEFISIYLFILIFINKTSHHNHHLAGTDRRLTFFIWRNFIWRNSSFGGSLICLLQLYSLHFTFRNCHVVIGYNRNEMSIQFFSIKNIILGTYLLLFQLHI